MVIKMMKDEKTMGILEIDPMGPFNGGAILSDRFRMQGHSMDEGVFDGSDLTKRKEKCL